MAHIMVRIKIPLQAQVCGCVSVAEDQCVAAGCVISANVNTVPHFLLLLAKAGPSPANTAAPPAQGGTGGTPSTGAVVSKCEHD